MLAAAAPAWPACDAGGDGCEAPADRDGDRIADDDEGGGNDTDRDGQPDFEDTDSDADGWVDRIEAGDDDLCTPPHDTDGDTVPDFRDPAFPGPGG